MSLQTELDPQIDLINTTLDELIPNDGSLFQAARHSLLAPAKRLRPVLTLTTTKLLGGNVEAATQPACAIEMIHTYSLIHDDLPCMDDDDFRRGIPTIHKAFTEAHAVLAGDYLLSYAFEVLSKAPLLSSNQKLELIQILSSQAGGIGMIGGQVKDIEAEGKILTLEELEQIHRRKTGALISASIEFGGVIAQAPETTRQSLKTFGEEIGLAFQIIDDVIDVTSNKGSDASNNKSTYVTLLGLSEAKTYAERIYHNAINILNEIPYETQSLEEIASYIVHRNL